MQRDVEPPEGWPGRLWLEGRTLMQVADSPNQGSQQKGPGSRDGLPVFHNTASAPGRTRSVLLAQYFLNNNVLLKEGAEVRMLDGLSASAARPRRILNELDSESAEHLKVVACDRDQNAIAWAEANHNQYPPVCGEIKFVQNDLTRLPEGGFNWVDIDPFGSPVQFLDSIMPRLSRKAVLEVAATDTAALTGSSPNATVRRYQAQVVNDEVAHETGIRVLLATIARKAAEYDRHIKPLLSLVDGHLIRLSLLILRGREGASALFDNLGWQVTHPTSKEVQISVSARLHPAGIAGPPQLRTLLPWDSPPKRLDSDRTSGPLWTGPLFDGDVLTEMSAERATEFCALNPEAEGERGERDSESIRLLGWNKREVRQAQEEVVRAVRHLSMMRDCAQSPHLYPIDELAQWLRLPGPPSPALLAETLTQAGYAACQAPFSRPAIRTSAPWASVAEIAASLTQNQATN